MCYQSIALDNSFSIVRSSRADKQSRATHFDDESVQFGWIASIYFHTKRDGVRDQAPREWTTVRDLRQTDVGFGLLLDPEGMYIGSIKEALLREFGISCKQRRE
jgi:hypothetical protein